MNSSIDHRRRLPTRARRGAALIALIALLSVITLLAAVWTRKIVIEHRHQRRVEELAQVHWLVESGLRRAAAQLATDPAFSKEEWRIPAADLGRTHDAVVVLHVEPADAAGSFRLSAEARYPATNSTIKRAKTVKFSPPNSEPAS